LNPRSERIWPAHQTELSLPNEARLVAGRYRLAAELGRGGMGVVWLADDQLVGRRVAVKELRPPQGLAGAEAETYRRRALQEARSAARIHHPGAVTLYDVLPASDGDDAVYLIMELVAGPTLAQVISQHGRLAEPAVAAFGLQLLDVLDAAHALGVVHRDIKPANILITDGGQAKLTDFGIAHTIGDLRLTRSGILGTQAYLAPELFESAPITPAADIWSLGATLYAAAQGASPFERDTTGATLRAILIDDLPAPRCSPALATALAGMLQRDPARRATTAHTRGTLQTATHTTATTTPATTYAATTTTGSSATPPHPAWDQLPTSRSPAPPPVPPPPRHAPPPPQHGQPRPPRTPGQSRRTAAIAAAVLAAAAITGGVLATSHHSTSHLKPVTSAHRHGTPQLKAPALNSITATLMDPGGQSEGVESLAFSPDGQTLAAGDGNGNTYLWNTATNKVTGTLADPNNSNVDAIAFTPDGQQLATGDGNGGCYLWNAATHAEGESLNDPGTGEVDWLTFGPDGQSLASTMENSNNNTVYVWNVATGKITARLTDPNSLGPNDGAFSPTGQTLAIADDNSSIYLWDVATRSVTATLVDPDGDGAVSDAFSANGQTLATGDNSGRTDVWNVATHSLIATLPDPGRTAVAWVALSPDGQMLATGYDAPTSSSSINPDANTVYLWNTATHTLTATLTDPNSQGAYAGAFSPDGQTLAIADGNGSTYLWQVPAGG
jgi:serine/threonine protein kinase/Tol biopolymer transport system component